MAAFSPHRPGDSCYTATAQQLLLLLLPLLLLLLCDLFSNV
jgi:hypothetical protein